ncbi:hypothetical protein L1987_45939 [Smallanthus sonchifolius]|uniref:Uncharacterized protein n=1 Tax=Smallanthus sonchifolius TaxID=185202 RepID=A0ACB9FXS4_9ASTR|nr:hypothetical protein L1987_45939 [Smallanthus sonchifolius]
MNSHFAPGGTLASVFLFLASGGNSLGRSVLVGLLGTEFTEIDFRYRISGIAFTVRDFRRWGIPSSLVCEFQAATAPIAALESYYSISSSKEVSYGQDLGRATKAGLTSPNARGRKRKCSAGKSFPSRIAYSCRLDVGHEIHHYTEQIMGIHISVKGNCARFSRESPSASPFLSRTDDSLVQVVFSAPVLVGLLGTEFTEIDFRYRISGIAFTVRDFRKCGIPSSLVCEFQAATAPIAALETGMRLAMLSSVFIRLAILSSVLAEFCLSFTAKG